MAAVMTAVIVIVFIAALRYIFGHPHTDPLFYTRPFYDPQTFSYGKLFGCTSIAVLTYIGFDGISTLSEEAENPRRNILLATVLTCLVIGILSAAEVYVAQLVWPASEPFINPDTAYVFAAARTWAPLFGIVGLTLLVANFGSGFGAQMGAARLLYGMGRSDALPKSFFGEVDPKNHIPRNNVLLSVPSHWWDRSSSAMERHRIVEFWCTDSVHGCQCCCLHALFRSGSQQEGFQFLAARAGFSDLRRPLVEFEPRCLEVRWYLDVARHRVRRVEDTRISPRTSKF